MIYTPDDLIAEIRAVGGIPAQEVPGYTKAELLKHASSYLRSRLLPAIVSQRKDYFTQKARIAIITGKNEYRIPERAVGDKLRAIWWIDEQGNRKKLDPIAMAELHRYLSTSTTIHGFYLNAVHIVLVGNPGGGWLEVLFPFRVGDLVLQTEARAVLSLNAGARTLTYATAVPTAWTAGTTKVDIHSALGGHDIRLWGALITAIDGPRTTITLGNDPIDGTTVGTYPVAAGDWTCLERQSALLALPEELIPTLARGVAQRIAEAEGDTEGGQHHSAEAEKDQAAAIPLIASDRVQTKPERFRGRRSPLFGG